MLSTAISGFLMGSVGVIGLTAMQNNPRWVGTAIKISAIATAAIAVAASFAFASVPVTGFLIAKTVFIAEAGFLAGCASLGCLICCTRSKSQSNANAHQ